MELRIIVPLCFLAVLQAHADDDCKGEPAPKSPANMILESIMCNYDKDVRPLKDLNKYMNVSVRLIPRFIEYNTYSTHSLTVNSWIGLTWKDEYLTWNPDDYDGTKHVHVTTDKIWAPEIKLNNGLSDSNLVSDSDCFVRYNGDIMCVVFSEHDALCKADLAEWPYDSQACELEYSSHILKESRVNISMEAREPIVLVGYHSNSEYELVNVTGITRSLKFTNQTFSILTYTYYLKRHAASETIVIVIPSLVIAIITLGILWLPATGNERFCAAMLIMYLQMTLLENLSWTAPKNGDTVPRVLSFCRDSLVMCTIVLLETLCVRGVLSSGNAPEWLLTGGRFLGNGIFKKILIPAEMDAKIIKDEEQQEAEIKIDEKEQKKFIVSIMLDRTTFIIMLIGYVIMIFMFLV